MEGTPRVLNPLVLQFPELVVPGVQPNPKLELGAELCREIRSQLINLRMVEPSFKMFWSEDLPAVHQATSILLRLSYVYCPVLVFEGNLSLLESFLISSRDLSNWRATTKPREKRDHPEKRKKNVPTKRYPTKGLLQTLLRPM